jgi:hypothetical protein
MCGGNQLAEINNLTSWLIPFEREFNYFWAISDFDKLMTLDRETPCFVLILFKFKLG